ncbi:hypothetical protein [Vulgatibacter sp.]|uniref:hypothetical protein n=1 Tax=Vulgatibacter sp. TaxID=1971226 RepID=UPI003566DAF2
MAAPLDILRAEAAGLGLQIQLGLGPRYDERAGAGLRLRDLAPFARGGLLLLSGGPAFFDRFAAAGPHAGADPLDDWTRALVERLLVPLRTAGIEAQARHPFVGEAAPLPFQRIGAAAGLGAPARIGLTLHPVHGSWIAYRALLLLSCPVEEHPLPAFTPCESCAAPCIPACPAGAVATGGWDAAGCSNHRVDHGDPCASGCHARLACPVGADARYGDEALRFHQAASFATASAWRNP